MGFVKEQGRVIPKEDRLFGISNRAKQRTKELGRDKVVNATIGVLTDDNGELIMLSSVDKMFKALKPTEYASYAPIDGLPMFKEAVIEFAFMGYEPKRKPVVCATPGGTGALHDAIANFTEAGDEVLITDWYWATYDRIASEIGRKTVKFELFKDECFNISSFTDKLNAVLEKQDQAMVILNTPAQNPTGYAMTDSDWKKIIDVLGSIPSNKKVVIVIDTAYIDFAGDSKEFRSFLGIVDRAPDNVLPIIAFSFSKTFTVYGLRCGAIITLENNEEDAETTRRALEYSSRAAWSNSPIAPQVIISKIYSDKELREKVDSEREEIRKMLLRRGKAFEDAAKECGLNMLPFTSGFFCAIPCNNPDLVSSELEKENIFLVPLAKGVRVSIAAISEDVCRSLPAKIKAVKDRVDK